MDFSIIIPVYNDSRHIKECVEHLLSNQLMKNIEIIIIDDGSTDNIDEAIYELKNRHSCIKYLKCLHKGLSATRNFGLKIATGKYVFFVDSDDLPEAEVLNRSWIICEEHDLDVLFFSFDSFGDNEDIKSRYAKHIGGNRIINDYGNVVYNGPALHEAFVKNHEFYPMVWLQVVRRDFLSINNIAFDERIIYEDNLYTFKTLLYATKAMCINKVLYHKRIRENSITTSNETAISVYSFLTTIVQIMSLLVDDFSMWDIYSSLRKIKAIQSSYYKTINDLIDQLIKRFYRLSELQREELKKYCSKLELSALDILLKKISVIVPLYNNELYIGECIQSIQNQTFSQLEIIVIDDGSTDRGRDIVDEMARADGRIKYIYQENSGPAAARNRGLEEASGDYIAFLDSDDFYVETDALEQMILSCLRYNKAVCCSDRIEYKNEKYLTPGFLNEMGEIPEQGKVVAFRDYQNDFFFQSFLYSSELLKENSIMFPNYQRYEDPVFLLLVMDKCQEFYVIPKVLHCYRKGHQAYSQNGKYILHNLRGIKDVLSISENKYNRLFDLSIERLKMMFSTDILSNKTPQVMKVLSEINTIIRRVHPDMDIFQMLQV